MIDDAVRPLRAAALAILATCALCAAPAAAQETVLRSFSGGSGPGAVGIATSFGTEDREEDGPAAITTDTAGRLYLLDQINGRILTFDSKRPAETRSLDLPPTLQPTDLVVKGNEIYVWDGRVHALQVTGSEGEATRGLAETRAAEPTDEVTRTAFAQMGSETAEAAEGSDGTRGPGAPKAASLSKQYVDTAGRGPVVADVQLGKDGTGATIAVRTRAGAPIALNLALKVRDKLGMVAFLGIDRSGRIYVMAENIPTTVRQAAFAFVARYSARGTVEGYYEVPLDKTTGVSRRFVTVSPDGDVYFLRGKKDSADIIGLGFRSAPGLKIIEAAQPKVNVAALTFSSAEAIRIAAGPLTREKVVQTALAFDGLRWTVGANNYGADDALCSGFNGRIRRPMYMIGRAGATVQGVPYCWGCMGSLSQFINRIQNGRLAGNVCTKDPPRRDVEGVDCSSFVSATWGLSTHFTTAAIPAITQQVANPWDMKPGDAFDKPGSHVMLFLRFTSNRQVEVAEASPGACQGRVCRNIYPMSSLLARGYIPVRYRGIIDK